MDEKQRDALNQLAWAYRKLKDQIRQIEEEMMHYKSALETAALEAGGELDLTNFKVTLVEASRNHFALEEAKASIPASVLEPFILWTYYTQFRVTEKIPTRRR